MIDFDPISAAAAREAVDRGVYGQPEHRRIEARMRAGTETRTIAGTTPESLTPEQWREDVLGVIRSVAGVAKNYDERGRSSMPIMLDEVVTLLYAANQYLAVTDAAALAAHDADVARKAAEKAWDEGQGEGTVTAINFTPLPSNPYRAEQIGEPRG